jgi:hypothetical protein
MNPTWRIVLLAVLPFMGFEASAAKPITLSLGLGKI